MFLHLHGHVDMLQLPQTRKRMVIFFDPPHRRHKQNLLGSNLQSSWFPEFGMIMEWSGSLKSACFSFSTMMKCAAPVATVNWSRVSGIPVNSYKIRGGAIPARSGYIPIGVTQLHTDYDLYDILSRWLHQWVSPTARPHMDPIDPN